MKKTVLFILALCLCFTIFGGTAFTENAQAETAERTEGEQAALEILTRQMTASAPSLIQWTATAGGSAAICPDCGYVLTEAGR